MISLSRAEARRIAIRASGLSAPRLKRVTQRDVSRVIRALGLVQLDFVTSVVPAHYQVLFSRLGPYDRRLLDHAVYESGDFTEQWAHEASIIPVETWPLLRHRRDTHRARPWDAQSFLDRHPAYSRTVLAEIRSRGPLHSDDMPDPPGVARRRPGHWYASVPRIVLEAHFGRGILAVTGRRSDFARQYDLAERVIRPEHFDARLGAADAQRELLRQAARASGVATAAELSDYFRMYVRDTRPRIEELRESGELIPAQVEGIREPAFLHRDATGPAGKFACCALLSPFDPLIWYRKRAMRLFQFDYRFEIFIPEGKRKWGSYVFPFLFGDRLAARVDLKSDRAASCLRVQAAYLEDGHRADDVAAALMTELRIWARWLGLDGVAVARKGNFAKALGSAAKSRPQTLH